MAEKIYMRYMNGSLIPADNYAARRLMEKKLKQGEIIGAVLTKLRNPGFHRLAFKLGQLCVEHIDSFENLDAYKALKRLQLESRAACDEIGIMIPGYGMVTQFIPRSLSYISQDEAEFQQTMRIISRHISDRYWPELSPAKIEHMAGVMVDE